jgi:flavin reductase (NADH)
VRTPTGRPVRDWATRPVRAAAYRDLMSAFPTGVAVVTAFDADAKPHGMTCTSLSSVAVSPPVLLVCLNASSGTLRALLASGAFAVNLLHANGKRAAAVFSSTAADRFARTKWVPSELLGAPHLVDDAFAVAECVLDDALTVGDHTVVFGAVVNTRQVRDAPLLYGMRQFAVWQTPVTSASQ